MTAIVQQGNFLRFATLLTGRLSEVYKEQPLPEDFNYLSVEVLRPPQPFDTRMGVAVSLEGLSMKRVVTITLGFPFDDMDGTPLHVHFSQESSSEADQLAANYDRTLYFNEARMDEGLTNVTTYLVDVIRVFFGLGTLPTKFDPRAYE